MATLTFLLVNIIILILVFIFSRIGTISWELVLTKKHSNDLENFMVVLVLFFAAAYGGVIGFSFDNLELKDNILHLLGTSIFFILMNIVVLITTSILMVYLVNALKSTSRVMLGIFLLINFSLFIYEVVAFDKTYYKKKLNIENICRK